MSKQQKIPQINLLIPLYNEEKVFGELIKRLVRVMESTDLTVSVIMTDDGSTDRTAELMRDLSLSDSRFTAVFLSRNFGHQLALTAGFSYVNASEAVLVLDGDLQDPPELLEEFYSYFKQGYDVVYAVRKKRKENIFKKIAYRLFYLILGRISYFKIPLDSGDFSLISRRVVNHLNNMQEESRFIRGMRSWVGFKQIGVPYKREERHSGKSKYSFRKLVQLAMNGIFNFSEFPIKLIFILGLLTTLTGLIYIIYTLYQRFFLDQVPEGFTALLMVIVLFGGIQLISIGIIGEYILRIFFQTKKRPLFIVSHSIENQEEKYG